jgi:hypothetical protein
LKNKFIYGQKHIALEIVAKDKQIYFYVAAPVTLVDIIEKSLSSQYPDAVIEEAEEHNIFSEDWKMAGVAGGEARSAKNFIYPIKTYRNMDAEPLESLLNTFSKLDDQEGGAIQVLIRPANPKIMRRSREFVRNQINGKKKTGGILREVYDAAMVNDSKGSNVAGETPRYISSRRRCL